MKPSSSMGFLGQGGPLRQADSSPAGSSGGDSSSLEKLFQDLIVLDHHCNAQAIQLQNSGSFYDLWRSLESISNLAGLICRSIESFATTKIPEDSGPELHQWFADVRSKMAGVLDWQRRVRESADGIIRLVWEHAKDEIHSAIPAGSQGASAGPSVVSGWRLKKNPRKKGPTYLNYIVRSKSKSFGEYFSSQVDDLRSISEGAFYAGMALKEEVMRPEVLQSVLGDDSGEALENGDVDDYGVLEYFMSDIGRAVKVFKESIKDLETPKGKSSFLGKASKSSVGPAPVEQVADEVAKRRGLFAENVRKVEAQWKEFGIALKEAGRMRMEDLRLNPSSTTDVLSQRTKDAIAHREGLLWGMQHDIRLLFEMDRKDNGARAYEIVKNRKIKDLKEVIDASKWNPDQLDKYIASVINGKQRGWNFLTHLYPFRKSRIGFGVKKLHSSLPISHLYPLIYEVPMFAIGGHGIIVADELRRFRNENKRNLTPEERRRIDLTIASLGIGGFVGHVAGRGGLAFISGAKPLADAVPGLAPVFGAAVVGTALTSLITMPLWSFPLELYTRLSLKLSPWKDPLPSDPQDKTVHNVLDLGISGARREGISKLHNQKKYFSLLNKDRPHIFSQTQLGVKLHEQRFKEVLIPNFMVPIHEFWIAFREYEDGTRTIVVNNTGALGPSHTMDVIPRETHHASVAAEYLVGNVRGDGRVNMSWFGGAGAMLYGTLARYLLGTSNRAVSVLTAENQYQLTCELSGLLVSLESSIGPKLYGQFCNSLFNRSTIGQEMVYRQAVNLISQITSCLERIAGMDGKKLKDLGLEMRRNSGGVDNIARAIKDLLTYSVREPGIRLGKESKVSDEDLLAEFKSILLNTEKHLVYEKSFPLGRPTSKPLFSGSGGGSLYTEEVLVGQIRKFLTLVSLPGVVDMVQDKAISDFIVSIRDILGADPHHGLQRNQIGVAGTSSGGDGEEDGDFLREICNRPNASDKFMHVKLGETLVDSAGGSTMDEERVIKRMVVTKVDTGAIIDSIKREADERAMEEQRDNKFFHGGFPTLNFQKILLDTASAYLALLRPKLELRLPNSGVAKVIAKIDRFEKEAKVFNEEILRNKESNIDVSVSLTTYRLPMLFLKFRHISSYAKGNGVTFSAEDAKGNAMLKRLVFDVEWGDQIDAKPKDSEMVLAIIESEFRRAFHGDDSRGVWITETGLRNGSVDYNGAQKVFMKNSLSHLVDNFLFTSDDYLKFVDANAAAFSNALLEREVALIDENRDFLDVIVDKLAEEYRGVVKEYGLLGVDVGHELSRNKERKTTKSSALVLPEDFDKLMFRIEGYEKARLIRRYLLSIMTYSARSTRQLIVKPKKFSMRLVASLEEEDIETLLHDYGKNHMDKDPNEGFLNYALRLMNLDGASRVLKSKFPSETMSCDYDDVVVSVSEVANIMRSFAEGENGVSMLLEANERKNKRLGVSPESGESGVAIVKRTEESLSTLLSLLETPGQRLCIQQSMAGSRPDYIINNAISNKRVKANKYGEMIELTKYTHSDGMEHQMNGVLPFMGKIKKVLESISKINVENLLNVGDNVSLNMRANKLRLESVCNGLEKLVGQDSLLKFGDGSRLDTLHLSKELARRRSIALSIYRSIVCIQDYKQRHGLSVGIEKMMYPSTSSESGSVGGQSLVSGQTVEQSILSALGPFVHSGDTGIYGLSLYNNAMEKVQASLKEVLTDGLDPSLNLTDVYGDYIKLKYYKPLTKSIGVSDKFNREYGFLDRNVEMVASMASYARHLLRADLSLGNGDVRELIADCIKKIATKLEEGRSRSADLLLFLEASKREIASEQMFVQYFDLVKKTSNFFERAISDLEKIKGATNERGGLSVAPGNTGSANVLDTIQGFFTASSVEKESISLFVSSLLSDSASVKGGVYDAQLKRDSVAREQDSAIEERFAVRLGKLLVRTGKGAEVPRDLYHLELLGEVLPGCMGFTKERGDGLPAKAMEYRENLVLMLGDISSAIDKISSSGSEYDEDAKGKAVNALHEIYLRIALLATGLEVNNNLSKLQGVRGSLKNIREMSLQLYESLVSGKINISGVIECDPFLRVLHTITGIVNQGLKEEELKERGLKIKKVGESTLKDAPGSSASKEVPSDGGVELKKIRKARIKAVHRKKSDGEAYIIKDAPGSSASKEVPSDGGVELKKIRKARIKAVHRKKSDGEANTSLGEWHVGKVPPATVSPESIKKRLFESKKVRDLRLQFFDGLTASGQEPGLNIVAKEPSGGVKNNDGGVGQESFPSAGTVGLQPVDAPVVMVPSTSRQSPVSERDVDGLIRLMVRGGGKRPMTKVENGDSYAVIEELSETEGGMAMLRALARNTLENQGDFKDIKSIDDVKNLKSPFFKGISKILLENKGFEKNVSPQLRDRALRLHSSLRNGVGSSGFGENNPLGGSGVFSPATMVADAGSLTLTAGLREKEQQRISEGVRSKSKVETYNPSDLENDVSVLIGDLLPEEAGKVSGAVIAAVVVAVAAATAVSAAVAASAPVSLPAGFALTLAYVTLTEIVATNGLIGGSLLADRISRMSNKKQLLKAEADRLRKKLLAKREDEKDPSSMGV